MASSSKRRGSSSKQSSAGNARVVSVKRKDALPRTGSVSAGRRKPVVQPPIDLRQTEPTARRTKTTRAAGRALGKPTKPAAVEPAAPADDVSAMTALEAPEIEALAFIETEVEVEASAIVEETTIVEAPWALPVEAVTFPSTFPGKRPLMTAVSRLLSTLCRWTGVRP